MFRKKDNQRIPVASSHSSVFSSDNSEISACPPPSEAGTGYPSIDKKHKKFSPHNCSPPHDAGGAYPSIDEKHKKFSPHDSGSDLFKDEDHLQAPEKSSDRSHDRLIKALSEQAYHLPGYVYWQDFRQYCLNNHPMFGICFHHKLHPVGWGMRALCFLASIVFGLVITNIVWLWAEGLDDNGPVFSVDVGENAQRGTNVTQYLVDINEDNHVEVTKDMIVLWTLGGAIHAFFDNTIWTLTICSFCNPGGRFEHLHKYKRFGVGMLAFAILFITAIATLSVVLRAAMESDEEVQYNELKSAGLFDDAVDFKGHNKESYEFLMSYGVELAMALLIHFPIVGFILFSGCLNVRGKIPMLGGRPYEVLQEEEELAEINGEVNPETGEPIQRNTDGLSNKERSQLLNSGVRNADDKDGKISGMAKFWNNKLDDSSSTASRGSLNSSVKSNAASASNRSSLRPARRDSTGSAYSENSRSNGSQHAQSASSNSSTGPNNRPQQGNQHQAPSSPTRGPRRVYIPPGARAYTGGRVYVPRQNGGGPGRGTPPGPGRGTPVVTPNRGTTPASPRSYPRGRPAAQASPRQSAVFPPRSPRTTATPYRASTGNYRGTSHQRSPAYSTTSPRGPRSAGSHLEPQNTASQM